MIKEVTQEKLAKYFDVTSRALKKVKIVKTAKIDIAKSAEDFLDMAKRYFEDAKHFKDKGDWVTAFAALNYAHGWLDAGVKLGIFDVDNTELFAGVDN